jgi:hypothetical protein
MSLALIGCHPRMLEPSKAEPVLEAALVQLADRNREVLPQARKIHEPQIHHLRAVFLGEGQDLFGFHLVLLLFCE